MNPIQLFSLLRWEIDYPPILSDSYPIHLNKVKHHLSDLLWTSGIDYPEQVSEIKVLIEALQAPSYERLLKGPSLYRVIGPESDLSYLKRLEFVSDFLKAEICLIKRENTFNKELWTSLNDYYIPKNERAFKRELIQNNDHNKSQFYKASVIEDSLVLDFESDWVKKDEPKSGVLNGPFSAYSKEEKDLITKKVKDALEIINKTAPVAGKLIKNFTKVIQFRKKEKTGISSEQVPREIGTIRISNAHKEEMTLLNLIDYLIHESLHNFLCIYENNFLKFAVYERNLKVRPVSPWSGNAIPHMAFTHAVFIYFGLYSFFEELESVVLKKPESLGQSIDLKEVREKMLNVSFGFRRGPQIREYLKGIGQTDESILNLWDLFKKDIDESCDAKLKNQKEKKKFIELVS